MSARLNRREFLHRSTTSAAAGMLCGSAISLVNTELLGHGAENQTKTFHAFSLKAAERCLQGPNPSQQELIARLGGVNKVTGIIVDPESHDCILIGECDPSLPDFHLDDLVMMLRSVFLHHDTEAPGVTIDPPEKDVRHGMQAVRYFGHTENSRVGLVCFEADYLMKRIGLGLEPSRVEGLETYFELSVNEARQSGPEKTEIHSRFWYYPVVARVVTVGNGVLLDQCELEVLTELLSATVDGKPVRNLDQFYHKPSERFAESFSEHFDQLASAWSQINDLRNLSALVAVTRGLARVDPQPDFDYWLRKYHLPRVETPSKVAVLRNQARELAFEVFGGVRLEALSLRLQDGDLTAFTEAVLQARRPRDALVWSVVVTADQQILVPVPAGRFTANSAAGAYARGHHLFRGGRYDLAIACWLQVTRTYPEMGEAFYYIAQAFERKGMPACAADYYTKAMHLDPFLKNFRRWNNSGAAHN